MKYDAHDGLYIIRVPHFTRYGFDESEEEDEPEEEEKNTASFPQGLAARPYGASIHTDDGMQTIQSTKVMDSRATPNDSQPRFSQLALRRDASPERSETARDNAYQTDSRFGGSLFKDNSRAPRPEIESPSRNVIIEEGDEASESEEMGASQSRLQSTYDDRSQTDEFKANFRKRHQMPVPDYQQQMSADFKKRASDIIQQEEQEDQEGRSGNIRLRGAHRSLGGQDYQAESEMREETLEESAGLVEESEERNLKQSLHEAEDFMKWLSPKTGDEEALESPWLKERAPAQMKDIEQSILTANKKLFSIPSQIAKSYYVTRQPEEPRKFYMHRSCRVGWSRDGLCVPLSQGRTNSLEIHKVILHKELYESAAESRKPFQEYKKKLKNIAFRTYEPLLKELVSASYTIDFTRKGLESMSLVDNSYNKSTSTPEFPRKEPFIKALASFGEHLSVREYSAEELSFIQEDLEIFGLLNILFGNPEFDLEAYVEKARTFDATEKQLMLRVIDSFSSTAKFYADYSRKVALSRWLELRATRVS